MAAPTAHDHVQDSLVRVGLTVERRFTTAGEDPFAAFDFVHRVSRIANPDGSVVFEMTDVEVPDSWDQVAVDILASKYFRKAGVPQLDADGNEIVGDDGEPVLGPERSAKQVMLRLANAWRIWGERGGYFASTADAEAYRDEMAYMLMAQMAAPNTPQFFNTGIFEAYGIEASPEGNWYYDPDRDEVVESSHRYERSAASACFISRVEDELVGPGSIFDFIENEARLFKGGSGSGANFSLIRAEGEKLSAGGTSSGVMSFLKVADRAAGAIKSGGSTRRAAKMVILDADHPDVEEFIWCKVEEERKVAALAAAGYSTDYTGEAYATVAFQNGNNSVRIPPTFMERLRADASWALTARTTGETVKEVSARKLWDDIATAAWSCADPGVQFDDILNDWNTVLDTERVNGTNPCFVGDTLVATDAGDVPIAELAARAANGRPLPAALAYDFDGSTRFAQITAAWCSGSTERLVEVTTVAGQTLRCTPDHMFLVDGNVFRAAERLREGDLLTAGDGGGTTGGAPSIDKVATVTVIDLDAPVDVFDVSVAGHHNFMVRSDAATPAVCVSNCSEYTHVDNTACNLASLNLVKFFDDDTQTFDTDTFLHAVRLWQTTLEITVSMAHYPSASIARKSYDHRTTGLGYCNIGALLMRSGIAYDSDRARAVIGAITSLMNSRAYRTSAELAAAVGPAPAFEPNRRSMLRVLRNHRRAAVGSLAQRFGLGDYEDLTVRPVEINHLTLAHTPFADLSESVVTEANLMVADVETNGARNVFTTVLAPTGTISLLMSAATTGIEPDFALVKLKKLAGGGYMRIVNNSVEPALRSLGYDDAAIGRIFTWMLGTKTLPTAGPLSPAWLMAAGLTADEVSAAAAALEAVSQIDWAFTAYTIGDDAYVRAGLDPTVDDGFTFLSALGASGDELMAASKEACGHLTVEGSPDLRPEHLPIFDCAVECGDGTRSIAWDGHVRALGAAQPHLSGATSKTINMSNAATVDDVRAAHDLSYELGVKCVAIYRDGSKLSQPLNSAKSGTAAGDVDDDADALVLPSEPQLGQSPTEFYANNTPPRFKLPTMRPGITWRIEISGEEVYLRSGEYADGTLGEIFIDWGRTGSTMRGLTSALSIALSQGLQHGVPLDRFVAAFRGHTFEPRGVVTGHGHLKMADSVIDAIVRILGHYYLGREDLVQVKGLVPRIGRVPVITDADTDPDVAAAHVSVVEMPATAADDPTSPAGNADEPAPSKGERLFGQTCSKCGGGNMIRSGACAVCGDCGETTGCS